MHRRAALAALIASLGALSAHGTVVAKRTFEAMTADADAVVAGTVGQQQARWDDAQRRIWTYTEIIVRESLKGGVTGSILVRHPGGAVDGIAQVVRGTPRLKAGSEVVLFLQKAADERGVYLVAGLSYGAVSLEKEGPGQGRARRKLEGLGVYDDQAAAGAPTLVELDEEDLGSAERFLQRLRAAVKAGRGHR